MSFKEYMKNQVENFKIFKWLESEKAGYDIGVDAAVSKYVEEGEAEKYRKTHEIKEG